MKLRTKYILFITVIHLTTLVMSFFIFQENKLLFILSEAVVLCSLYFSFRLYQSLVSPIQLIARGVDAIEDQDFNVKFQPVGQYEMDKLIGVYNQMIDELRQERTRTAQKHFLLEKLIKSSPTGIIMLSLDDEIASCNPRALELLNYPEKELLGKSLVEFDDPLLKALAQLPKDTTQTIQLNGMETYKCHKAHFIDRGFPKYFILIEELTAEKLEIEKQAYGKVIRMMAHEVNNSIGPINSILNSLNTYRDYLPEGERSEFTEVIKVARDRNHKLNLFMQNFAGVVRLPQPMREPIDLREVIRDVTTLMAFQLDGKEIEFQLDLPEKPVPVSIDVRQIEQVLINVIKNAIEAIEQQGRIQVRLQQKPLQLQIIDNGAGIAPEITSQVFASFFSTKQSGQGVGLTLVREILMNHGFGFSLKSGEEGETVFRIDLER